VTSILAIGAHPDDIEAGCFGTLLKHKESGDKVGVVITTKGGVPNRPWKTVLKEIEEAQSHLGIEFILLGNPNGHYPMNWETVSQLDRIIEQEKAETIYTVWHGDSHQDHRMTYRNVLAAARKKSIKNLYCFELPDYSYRSEVAFTPRRYVDITPFMKKKEKAVMAYKSYFDKDYLNALEGLARHRGGAMGVKYAESFEIVFEMWK
jgi:LmbE family N-acetylglucosaminyl deacetylase